MIQVKDLNQEKNRAILKRRKYSAFFYIHFAFGYTKFEVKDMKKLLIMLFAINLALFSTSCKKQSKEEVKIKNISKIPKELLMVEITTDEIQEELLELKKQLDKSDNRQVEKEKEEMIKKLQEERTKETEKTTEKIKVVETHKEKVEKTWINLNKKVATVHRQLNDYKVLAIEDKANEENIKQIEENLNNLTIFVENKELLNSFIANNEIYKDLSYFLSLYEEYKSQLIKLKYQTNNIYIYALKDEWKTVLEGMSQVDSQYSEVLKEFNKEVKLKDKPSETDKNKEKDLDKLKSSIDSLKQSTSKEDVLLIEIKRDIVFKDIEKVGK